MKVRVAPQPAKETQATQEGTDPKKLTAGQQAAIDYGLNLLGVESIDALYGDSELANMSNALYRGQNNVTVAALEGGTPGDVESTSAFDPNNEEHLKYAYAGLASSIKNIYESINDGSENGAQLGFKSLDNYVSLINDPEAQRNSQVTIYKSDSSMGNPINIEVDYDLSSSIYDGKRWTASGNGDALVWNIGSDGVNYGITNPGNTMFPGNKAKNKPARLWRDGYYDVYEAGNLTPQENLKMLYRSGSINDDGSVSGSLGSLIGFGENQIVNPYVLHSMVSDRVAEGRINAGRTVVQQPSSILPNPYRTSTGSRK